MRHWIYTVQVRYPNYKIQQVTDMQNLTIRDYQYLEIEMNTK